MGTTMDVAKRLSFGDLSLHTPEVLDVPELLAAFRAPSARSFERALEQLVAVNGSRFEKMLAASHRQAESGSESDLQRLRKQLSMVKNNFQTYDVQDEFMSALLSGDLQQQAPAGDAHADAAELKQHKDSNDSMREEILESIVTLVEANNVVSEKESCVKSELETLAKEVAAHQAWKSSQQENRQSSPMSNLTSEADSLERMCVEHEALAVELESAIASELDEMEALHAEVQALEEANARSAGPGTASRFTDAGEWCRELEALFATLSGVEVAAIDEGAIQLRLTTHTKDAQGSVQVATHSLEVCLAPGEAGVQSLAVSPPGVPLADIQAFALQGGRGVLPLAVQQVHARLAADARRKLGLQAARKVFQVTQVTEDATLFRCLLAGGAAELECRLPLSWPAPGVGIELIDLQAGSGADLTPILQTARETGDEGSLLNKLHSLEAAVSAALPPAAQ
eukprot:jgi/Tetstr1/463657/TSEL_008518.t1